MKIIGLTGSIGMGKTTVAAMLRRLGIPVDAADDTARRLMVPGSPAYRSVARNFPDAIDGHRLDRTLLGELVFADPARLKLLEQILHPEIARMRERFLAIHRRRRSPIVVLDIPLLFEKGLDKTVDAVMTVSAPAFVQKHRVLYRPGMSEHKFRNIMSRQIPDAVKRRRSDIVIRTGTSKAATLRQLKAALNRLHWASHARNRSRYRNHRR
jgi:dephospho-CoA kinase